MAELSFVEAKRVSDRVRGHIGWGWSNCTADKVQRVQRGESIGDRYLEVAIQHELAEYGFEAEEGSGS